MPKGWCARAIKTNLPPTPQHKPRAAKPKNTAVVDGPTVEIRRNEEIGNALNTIAAETAQAILLDAMREERETQTGLFNWNEDNHCTI